MIYYNFQTGHFFSFPLTYRLLKTHNFPEFNLYILGLNCRWYYVCRARKLNYENFHKNYDFDKEYARMKKAGVFKGIPAE